MPLDRTGLVRLVVLALVAAIPDAMLHAQCDPQTATVTGTVDVADGSTNPPGNGAQANPIPSYPNWWIGPLPGSITINAFPGVPLAGQGSSTYEFEGRASHYLSERGGSATCWRTNPGQCIHCSGSFSFGFHSAQGTVEGEVTYDDGTPIATTVFANGVYQAHTNPFTGKYRFTQSGAPPQNNWGLPVYRTGTSGPGTATHSILPWGWSNQYVQQVTISSNSLGKADFQLPRNETDPRDECTVDESGPSPGSSPGAGGPDPSAPGPPGTVSNPVSVITGNMHVDQTDALIPGAGMGLRFSRSYNSHNSADAERYGVFGPGWSHSYEKRLTFPSPNLIKLREADGTPRYFQDVDQDGVYVASAPYTKASRIVVSGTLYTREYRKGGREVYDRQTPTGATARLKSLANAAGASTSFTYTGSQLTAITDPGGRQLTIAYSGPRPTSLSGPAGLIANFTYAGNALQGVTYADGDGDAQPDGGYSFAYHASGKLHTVTDLSGRVLETHEYDAAGRVTAASISNGVEAYALDYTSQPNATLVTDALGNVTRYDWVKVWGKKRIVKITGPCAACGGGSETQEWTYDSKGRVTSHKDGEGNVTRYDYDADGNLLTVTPPQVGSAPAPTTYTYYPDGRVQTRTGPNGGSTTWTYVAAGPDTITERVSPGVTRTTGIAYTPLGKPRVITDPLNHDTVMEYTALGDLGWVEDPLGHQTSFEYDVMGRREKTIVPATTPANDTPRMSYDTLGRVWRVTNPNGSYWRHWYDGGGRRIRTRDPHDEQTQLEYDIYGRLWKVIDPLGGETEYGYDLMSNLTSLSDARDKITTFAYDGHHRVKKVIYPSMTKPQPFEEFTYDVAGRLKTRKDRKGVTTTFAYDARGRRTGKTYSDGSPAVTFGYDANGDVGFMTSASNSADTLAWDYDLVGQILSEASTRNATTVSYVHDLAGRRRTLRLNGADVLTYGYQADDQLDTITRAPGAVFDFNPDAAHRRQSVVFPNGTTTDYEYDLLSRLSRIRLKRGAVVVSDIAYESNDLDNRMSRTEDGTRLQYGYDALSRLLTVDRTLPTPTVRREEYTYDPVGNRLTALGIPGLWSYGDRNELQGYNGITFGYDLNGNQTSRSGSPARTYVWDVENRLTIARDNGVSVASFEYDPIGRRVAKTTSDGTTLFGYDGEDILVENGPSGSSLYVHGPGIDEPLARGSVTGILTRFYHLDGLGSLVKRTDSGGNVENSRTYDSFGQPAVYPPSGYAFTSREWDSETGLYDYRARYYDPKIGRFISADPIGLLGGDLNLYAYVYGDPTDWIDPSGEGAVAPTPTPHPTPKPPATPLPSGGLQGLCFLDPAPRRSTPPGCIGDSPCPCGYEPDPDPVSAAACFVAGGNVPTLGTTAEGDSTPPTGMTGPATKQTIGTAGPSHTAGPPPGVPNAGAAGGAAHAAVPALANFCGKAGIRCKRKGQ